MERSTPPSGPLDAFDDEAERLAGVLHTLADADLDRATPCPPWTVRELVVHVRNGAARPVSGLAVPPPPAPALDATGYFNPGIFDAASNAERVEATRRDAAAYRTAAELAAAFDDCRRRTREAVRAQPPDRIVVTRHGDGMLLTEFMATRVVELALHGLDLAIALDRAPWTAPSAAGVVADLLVASGADRVAELGWDQAELIAKASGRTPPTPAESAAAARLGITWLPLG
ncbi:maleylpyruvate isomerase N-terminal domain-containing protein [Actinomadura macrotermitis]|uniref:maleylpyruvate isomerase N-terminal domain-containing protein n=1 Tax=Actinomadura macrotermitis TaxID=2585200 RepID=UPI001A9B39B9|nr:maleylpyruvate isomerase N-terminal domain-containing protein [Actinomadura macrotermitis]